MCTTFWLEVCYFYISQIESSSDKIFYKVVYHHIIYICGEFRRFFFLSWFAWIFTKLVISTRYPLESLWSFVTMRLKTAQRIIHLNNF